jgi:predicted O-methyltransferase YrrM
MTGAVARPRTGPIDRAYRALGDPRARPNVGWVRRLAGASDAEVRRVLAEGDALVPMGRAIRAAHRASGRAIYAQIRAPFELYALVRLLRPERVVETGVSSGVSSAHFLAALRRNRRGRLYSIDLPTYQRGPTLGRGESAVSLPPGRGPGWVVPERLRDRWDLRLGSSETLLPQLVAELPSIDLFLHDDRHTPRHLAFELAAVRPRLSPGAVVLADNTAWTGAAFPRFARSLRVPWYRRGRTDLVGLRAPVRAKP